MNNNLEKEEYHNLFDKKNALLVINKIFDDKTAKQLSQTVQKIDMEKEKEILKNTEHDFLFYLDKSIEQKNSNVNINNSKIEKIYDNYDDDETEVLTVFGDENSLKLKLVNIIDKDKEKEDKITEIESTQIKGIGNVYIQKTLQKFKTKRYKEVINSIKLLNIQKTNFNFGEKYVLQEFFWDEKKLNLYFISVEGIIRFIIPEKFS